MASYVILPARDYADGSYYRGNIRNHTTAAVAFLYSYSSPKLRVHGADGTAAETSSTSRLPESNLGELRTFRSADGSASFDGRLVGFDPASGIVRISLKHGGTRDLEFMAFSEEDQAYLKTQLAEEE